MKKEHAKKIQLQEKMSVKDLSEVMGIRVVDILKTIIKMGEEPKTIMHELDAEVPFISPCSVEQNTDAN